MITDKAAAEIEEFEAIYRLHADNLYKYCLYYLEDEEHTAQIELTYNDETPENGYENGNAFGHFAFSVDSMSEFTSKMNSLGYEYLYEPFEIFSGTIIAFVKDPDGNEIELIQKAKKL